METDNSAQKLGGKPLNSSTDARASSVAAAYHRLFNASTNSSSTGIREQVESIRASGKEAHHESHLDDYEANNGTSGRQNLLEPSFDNSQLKENVLVGTYYSKPSVCSGNKGSNEPDPDDCLDDENMFEPDPDDSQSGEAMESEPCCGNSEKFYRPECCEEPVYNNSRLNNVVEPDPDDSQVVETAKDVTHLKLGECRVVEKSGEKEPDPDDCKEKEAIFKNGNHAKADPDNSQKATDSFQMVLASDNQELQRIEDPVTVLFTRLHKAIEMLRLEATPTEANLALQTLFKIIK